LLPFKESSCLKICCARGGMRSRSFANYLAFNGFIVQQVEGGYRDYRASLVPQFNQFFRSSPAFALTGRTGVGKTMLLEAIARRIPSASLDLEGCAQHRASMFGSFGKSPRTQQQFESELLYQMWRIKEARFVQELSPRGPSAEPIFLEAEGSKIGNVHLPQVLNAVIDRGPHILCVASIETRVQRLVREYWFSPGDAEALAYMQRVASHPLLSKSMSCSQMKQLQDSLLTHSLDEFVYLLLKYKMQIQPRTPRHLPRRKVYRVLYPISPIS